jgi:hypothetical protein
MTDNQREMLEVGCAQLESRAGLVWGPEFIEEFAAALRARVDENAALKAEVAALKAERDVARQNADALRKTLAEAQSHAETRTDPLAEMWTALAEYQPQADRDGHGDTWARMCRERTKEASQAASSAASAASAARAADAIAAIRKAKKEAKR